MAIDTVAKWHAILANADLAGLGELLAEDAVFHSPIVHSPQVGKELTTMYLSAAYQVLGHADFRYVREVVGARDAVLEFVATLDGIHVNGVDMMHWNEDGKIDDFKVMIRPLKAINLLHQKMRDMLERMFGNAG